MKILLVHNRYQHRGGEDAVVVSEKNLLSSYGVEAELLEVSNDAIIDFPSKVAAALSVFYSAPGVGLLNRAIARFRPDIVHVHNWFPTLSPGIFWACKRQRIPVIQTLHNYRLLCASGMFFRDGRVCEDCIGTTLRSPSVVHACYRGSRPGTAMVTGGMVAHWALGTWHKAVDRFIALTEFQKRKLIEGGLPASRIVVKPNFLDFDPGLRPGNLNYVAFVGRLSEEKGIRALLQCWRHGPCLPLLKIVGSGPLENEVRETAHRLHNLEWCGPMEPNAVLETMGGAQAVLCPSLCYEGMPRVVIESFAVGTPVIAPATGSYLEMIRDGETGALYDSSDPGGLIACVKRMQEGNRLASMRPAPRLEFETRYTAATNFKLLDGIYRQVLAGCAAF